MSPARGVAADTDLELTVGVTEAHSALVAVERIACVAWDERAVTLVTVVMAVTMSMTVTIPDRAVILDVSTARFVQIVVNSIERSFDTCPGA